MTQSDQMCSKSVTSKSGALVPQNEAPAPQKDTWRRMGAFTTAGPPRSHRGATAELAASALEMEPPRLTQWPSWAYIQNACFARRSLFKRAFKLHVVTRSFPEINENKYFDKTDVWRHLLTLFLTFFGFCCHQTIENISSFI